MRIIRQLALIAPLYAALPTFSPAQAFRPYIDRATGVSFSYPAAWLLNGDDDAATAKLRLTLLGQPSAIVQLEGNFADHGPYRGTDFEAGAFAYVVLPAMEEAACLAMLDRLTEDEEKPVSSTWKGQPTRRLIATYDIAGTDDSHVIIATWRASGCYVFETVLVSKSIGGPIKPLVPARWTSIRSQFTAVLRSVQLRGALPKKP